MDPWLASDVTPEARDLRPEARIFYLETDALPEEARRAWLEAAGHLDPEERARRDRYLFDEKKLEITLGRALVKGVLSSLYGVEGARILTDPEGSKPRLAGPGPSWNLSHSKGLLALIVGPPGSAVGIDVERIRWDVKDELIRYTMRDEELPSVTDALSFTRAWTAKEAYMKLLGSGLAIAPRRLRVDHERRTVTDCERGETRAFAWERRGGWVASWMAE